MGLHESHIKDIFPTSKEEMKSAGQFSDDFFIQICGGPAYFKQSRGARQIGKDMRPRFVSHPIHAYTDLSYLKKRFNPS